MIVTADFHIHTCLSPCGDLEMSPISIVLTALNKGIQIIGISDHNSAANIDAVMKAGKKRGLFVVPAMEISSLEEAHILCLFPNLEAALKMQEDVYLNISKSPDESYIQDQVIASEDDEVEGFCPFLLIASSRIPVKQIVNRVHNLDGLAIAAHIDRPSFSVISQLGFIPPQIQFDALEVSANLRLADASSRFPEYETITFITDSDAHYLHDIGRVFNRLDIPEMNFSCIRDAMRQQNGCKVLAM